MLQNFNMVEITIRVFSIVAVFSMYQAFPKADYVALFVAVLFAHYLLAAYYSRKQIFAVGRQKIFWPALSVLGLLGAMAIYFRAAIFIPFICLHVALSEVYMSGERLCFGDKKFWEKINVLRVVFYVLIFVSMLRNLPVFSSLSSDWVLLAACGLFLGFYRLVFKKRRQLGGTYLYLFAFDFVAVIFAIGVQYAGVKLTQQELVFYHITTWIVSPVLKFVRGRNFILTKEFAVLNVFFVAMFYFVQRLTGPSLAASIPLWGSIHFILTFATSRLNPQVISQYFYPAK